MNALRRPNTRWFSLSALALAFAGSGCTTQVAVDSPVAGVADYRATPFDGTLHGVVQGDIPAVFQATNRALDDLKYFRVGQSADKTMVVARGMQDVKVEVDLAKGKDAGTTNLAIEVGSGDLPKSQQIFKAIVQQLKNANVAVPAATPDSGMVSPSRPSGS